MSNPSRPWQTRHVFESSISSLTNDLCVGALASRLSISKAAVSQHLQILRKANLVRGEKLGYWTHYSVERTALRQIAEALMEIADQAPDFRMVSPHSTDDTNPSCVPKEENQ